MVQVILKETILGLGKFGEVVDVKPGYARNFLVPQHKALPVTEENRSVIESQRKDLEAKEADRRKAATELAKRLAAQKFMIEVTTSDGTRLYGSIGVSEVKHLLDEKGYEQIEKRAINIIDGPIREVGEYKVLITYHADVQDEITVRVVADANATQESVDDLGEADSEFDTEN